MPRTARAVAAGGIYHVLNRGNGDQPIFLDEADYDGFCHLLADGLERYPVRLLGWCLMRNHWHLILRPGRADSLGKFLAWVGVTHARRHNDRHRIRGGHLYGGRFKSFPIQGDHHLATVCRYLEGNPKRSKVVRRAEKWRWSSLAAHAEPSVPRPAGVAADAWPTLTDWPIPRPRDWIQLVNQPLDPAELEALRTCVNRGRPFGDGEWVDKTVKKLGLLHTVRNRGRPRKIEAARTAGR